MNVNSTTRKRDYLYPYDIAVLEATPRCCSFTPDPSLPCPYLQNFPDPVPAYTGAPCVGGSFFVQNAGGFPQGTLFTWYQNGQIVANGASVNINYPIGSQGTITVMAYPPYGCMTQGEIPVPQCCVPQNYAGNTPSSYTATGVPGSNKASDMLAHFGGAVPQGASIYINGNFDIDVNLIWIQVTAAFGENAKITMQNGRTFTAAKNSHLFACDKMWQGIEADHPTEMIHIMDSKVEDAYRAVSSLNGGNFSLSGTTFNRNENHVGVFNFAGTHPGTISNCTFTCEDANGSMAFLNAPMNTSRTAFGIIAWNVNTLNIGTDLNLNTTGNNFRFANTHVYAVASGLNIKRSNFSEMLGWTNPTLGAGGQLNVVNGVAVCGFGLTGSAAHNINIGGGGTEACSFNGNASRKGAGLVTTNNFHVSVLNSSFSNLKYGIAVNKLSGWQTLSGNNLIQTPMNLNVFVNTFNNIDSCGVYGVAYLRANVNVSGNTMTNLNHKGIYFGNVSAVKMFLQYAISSNTLSGVRPNSGIHLINCSRASVLANTVNFTASAVNILNTGNTRYGIRAEGCGGIVINDNQVRRSNTSAIFSNSTYLKLQGINVAACPGATVCNNTLERLGTGMRFMLDNSGIRIRKNLMQSDHTGIDLYQAKIANPLVFAHDYLPTDNRWNNILGGNTTRRLTGSSNQNTIWRWRNNNNTDYNPYIHTVLPQIGTTFATLNAANPSTLVTCFGQMVSSVTEENLQREALFGETVDHSEGLTPEDSAALRLISEKQAYFYLVNDSSLWASNLPEDDKFRNYVIEKENELLGALKTVQDYELQGDKNSALAQLQLIFPNGTAETFEKVVNEIYISHWMQDTLSFDSTTMETLMLIANLSMEDGGSAVLGARVLLGGDALEMESKMGDPLQKEENLEAMISVYPNPTYGYINFLTENMDLGFHFTMYTTEGVKVFDKYLNTPSPIEIFDISQGLYLYEIRTADMKKKTGKLVIMKN